jgi:hypothetical protein
MKISPWSPLSLAALLTAGFCPLASANLFTDNFEATVVAERAKDAPPESKAAVSYVMFDGGYVEAGDPIAGDTPPTADQVRQELRAALEAQGFQQTQGTPSLVLTYYWGVLRRDREQIRVPFGIKTNLRARIALVSTEELGAETENYIVGKERGSSIDLSAAAPVRLTPPIETVLQHASLPRIFIIVSAYDYQELSEHHQSKLVWRAKLSALETSGESSEVIPPLIALGGQYFGKDILDVRTIKTTLMKAPPVTGGEAANAQASPESVNLDAKFIQGFIRAERSKVSGEGT